MDSRDPLTLALLCAEVLDCAIAARQVTGAGRVSQIEATNTVRCAHHLWNAAGECYWCGDTDGPHTEDRYFVDDADIQRPRV